MKNKNNKRNMLLLALAIITVSLMIAMELKIKKEVVLEIKDNCGVFLNTVMHQIDSDDACKIRCINQCKVADLDYSNHVFQDNNQECNTCKCYCD